jgi:hypothetical protein
MHIFDNFSYEFNNQFLGGNIHELLKATCSNVSTKQ